MVYKLVCYVFTFNVILKNRTKIIRLDLVDKLKTLLLCAPKKLKLLIE